MSPEDDVSTNSTTTNHSKPSTDHHILDLDNNRMINTMLNEMDENCNNGKLNGIKNGKHHNHMNGNGGIINNHDNHNVNDNNKICNGNGERRDSASNVWSPLLQKTDEILTNGHKIINNNGNNNTSIIYDPNKKNNNDDWKDNEEINNLRNNYHKNHINNNNINNNNNNNNNGSILLMNGKKNGIVDIDKLMEEHDPLTGKKQIYDDNNSSNVSYDNTTSDDYNTSNNDDSDTNGTNCGLFGCKPKWGKRLASTHVFMVVFLLAWVFQGMFLTYFVSVITTIEKLFQFKSRTTGMLLSASEIGQICTAMLLTYYAGRGHRPRWIGCGMVLFSIAAFGCALPHFIFGRELMQSSMFMNGENMITIQNDNILNNTNTNISMSAASLINSTDNLNLCLHSHRNLNDSNECQEEIKLEQASHSKIRTIVLCIFFVSLLSSGIGQTAVSTLGIPYIDDNVASRDSPIYMAITIGVRILGPATGFIIGSFCTRIFVDLSKPSFDSSDPRWISAWWLGPVCIGSLMLIASIAMFSFPRQLRGTKPVLQSDQDSNDTKTPQPVEAMPKLKDFPKTVRRQFSNDILMFRTASSVFHLLPIAGLYTFLPKYLETQFRLAAADANLMTAFGGILVMGVGIVISGYVILKLNPTAKTVAGWIAFTALVYSCGMAVLMFVGCNMDNFEGLTRYTSDHQPITPLFEPSCNITCNCDVKEFSPICGRNGKTYFSACHAGCSTVQYKDGKPVYFDCECIPNIQYIQEFGDDYVIPDEKFIPPGRLQKAVSGYCDNECQNFIYFICIFAFCVFMHSTSEVGSMLLIMRCTDPKDKAMAMGVIHSAIGLFGNVPCPIIYGAVIDSACLVWKTVCGKPGACSLYDTDSFRYYFLGITSGIMFIAFIMDLIVWSKAHRIDIAPEDNTSSTETDIVKPMNASASDTSV